MTALPDGEKPVDTIRAYWFRFTPKFACGRTLVPDVSLPLLGVSIRGAEKGGNEIFVTMGVKGEFLHFGAF